MMALNYTVCAVWSVVQTYTIHWGCAAALHVIRMEQQIVNHLLQRDAFSFVLKMRVAVDKRHLDLEAGSQKRLILL